MTGTNGNTGPYWYHMNFYISNEEVRPKNTAIKIWKRIQ